MPINQQLPEPLDPVPAGTSLDEETAEKIARIMKTARIPDYAQAYDDNSLREFANRTWDTVEEL
jgi:hypothetical protein